MKVKNNIAGGDKTFGQPCKFYSTIAIIWLQYLSGVLRGVMVNKLN